MSEMKDQYLKAFDIFNEETTRFWTRFNLFTGLQIIFIVGLASNFDSLMKYRSIAIMIVWVALVFSIFTILVMGSSYMVNIGMIRAIEEIEKKDDSFILFATYGKHRKVAPGIIAVLCVAMSLLLTMFWIVLLVKM